MAKEKTEETTETKKSKQYKLTDTIRRNAYYGKIDGREIVIDFERNFKGEPNSLFSSVGHYEGTAPNLEFVSDKKDYLEDLTPKQVKELAYAGVIKTDKTDRDIILTK